MKCGTISCNFTSYATSCFFKSRVEDSPSPTVRMMNTRKRIRSEVKRSLWAEIYHLLVSCLSHLSINWLMQNGRIIIFLGFITKVYCESLWVLSFSLSAEGQILEHIVLQLFPNPLSTTPLISLHPSCFLTLTPHLSFVLQVETTTTKFCSDLPVLSDLMAALLCPLTSCLTF